VAKSFASFLVFEKGSRRKGETIGGRYRSNGYVLNNGYVLRQQSPTAVDGQALGVMGQENQKPKQQRGGLKAALIAGLSAIPCRSERAPGGVPTMVVNDDAGQLSARGDLRFFASMLAPTGDRGTPVKVRSALRPPRFAFDLGAPLTTMAERRHCAVGKPAGRRFSRAGPGTAHRGDPRSNAGERACRA
jgi:hypothetical protein